MSFQKTRFIALCQQLLVLGAVFAALVPAANVVSLDVVRQPGATPPAQAAGAGGAYLQTAGTPIAVPAEEVEPIVEEVPLVAPAADPSAAASAAPSATPSEPGRAAAGSTGRTVAGATAQPGVDVGKAEGTTVITSEPQDVSGYGAVGVTWAPTEIDEHALEFELRTSEGGAWSAWEPMAYHDEHAPDPGSPEAEAGVRPGTDERIIGNVDQVQVRATVTGAAVPADMKLAVISPGKPADTDLETPEIETGQLDSSATPAARATDPATDPAPEQAAVQPAEQSAEQPAEDGLVLQSASTAQPPAIFSRAQWGADERIRDAGSLRYGTIAAGFVHHTVNANDYTAEQVPGIIRSIYAYHVKSRGWSDVGYNFLIDRFGRIWEGRYGGVDRAVVGAHTENYNDYSFGAAAIGNFDVAQPPAEVVNAFGTLFGWKLGLAGVDPASPSQRVGKKNFPAIAGHRDTKATACPGKYLYAQISTIRSVASSAQVGWTGQLQSNLAGAAYPDLIVRGAADKMGYVIPTGGLSRFAKATTADKSWKATAGRTVPTPDVTGDGLADLVMVSRNGAASVRPGNGQGRFGKALKAKKARTLFAGYRGIAAAGDIDANGTNDLVGRSSTGKLTAFLGKGKKGKFKAKAIKGKAFKKYNVVTGAGDQNGDGHPDLFGRDAAGRAFLHLNNGSGGFGKPQAVAGDWGGYDTVTGLGDFTGDGRADLFVRNTKNKAGFVVPSRGNGVFGRAVGPFKPTKKMGAIAGAVQLSGNALPELVGVDGRALQVAANAGTIDLGAPIATGISLANADAVLNAGDFDRDGDGDVLARDAATGNVQLYRGDGTGRFGAGATIGSGFGGLTLLAASGDLTGDGLPDLMTRSADGTLRIHPGTGSGFGTAYSVPGTTGATSARMVMFPGQGPAGLTDSSALNRDLTPYDWVIGVSSLELGSTADLLVREAATGYLYALRGKGEGKLKPARFLGEGMGGYDLAG